MSFCQDVKKEIFENVPSSRYIVKCELEVFYRYLVWVKDGKYYFKSENKRLLERFIYDLHFYYNLKHSSKSNTIEIKDEKIMRDISEVHHKKCTAEDMSADHKKQYIKILFLICGYIQDPSKEYHLEIPLLQSKDKTFIQNILFSFEVHVKSIRRKNVSVLYLKDSEQISKFLSIVEAFDALMAFENTKIVKDVRNVINREINCETSNIKKTVNASLRQIKAIEKIIKLKGIHYLAIPLKEVAEARLNNRDLSLIELASLVGLSKSCVNHRLRKIMDISEALH